MVGYLLEYKIDQTLQDELDKKAVEFLLAQIRTGKLEDPECKAAINELLQKPLTAHLCEQWHDEVLTEIIAQWQQGKLLPEIEQAFNQLLPAELLKLQREINDELYTQSRLDQLREKELQLAELRRQIQDLLARAEQLSQTIEVLQPTSVNDDDVTPNHSPRHRS